MQNISKTKKHGYEPLVEFKDVLKVLIEWGETLEGEDKFRGAYKELESKGLLER